MNSYDVFVSVVKLGSFSAAAKALHRSPSAISKLIAGLEQSLNVQLFDRTTRTLKITEAGRIYHEHCQDISRRINDTEEELRELAGEPSGELRISWGGPLHNSRVFPVLAEFSKRYPKVVFNINTSTDYVSLPDENIDFAFRQGPLEDSSLVAIKLFDIQPVFCASPDFVKRHGLPKSLNELIQPPIAISDNMNLREASRKYALDLQLPDMENIHITNSLPALRAFALNGICKAFSFRHIVEEDLAAGRLVDITPAKALPPLPIYLVYQRYTYMPRKLRVFIDTFKEAFANDYPARSL